METTNKTPLTIDKKTFCKIAASYIGQQIAVFTFHGFNSHNTNLVDWMLHRVNQSFKDEYIDHKNWTLLVKPLGEILNTEAVYLQLICDKNPLPTLTKGERIERGQQIAQSFLLDYHNEASSQLTVAQFLECADYLRSRGYALPYGEYSVEQLVEAGIYKLIE